MGFYRRLLNLGRRSRVYRDVDRELSFHIAERVDDLVAAGMNRDEARRAAERQFGNYSLQTERTRDVDVIGCLDSIGQDVRHALRMMRRSVGFTAVAIITLAF